MNRKSINGHDVAKLVEDLMSARDQISELQRQLAEAREKLRWLPICEMHEDFGQCEEGFNA